jgi:hypothetical protein
MVSLMKRSAAADGRRRVRRPDIVATLNHFVGILAPDRQAQPKLPRFLPLAVRRHPLLARRQGGPREGIRWTADRSSNSTSVVAVDTLVRPLRADEARQSGALPRCSRSLTGLRSSASGNTRKAAAYAERRLDYAWRPSSTAYPTCVPMGRWMADLRARSSRQIAGSAAAAIKDIAQKPRAPKSP